jgi:hypothetical protein
MEPTPVHTQQELQLPSRIHHGVLSYISCHQYSIIRPRGFLQACTYLFATPTVALCWFFLCIYYMNQSDMYIVVLTTNLQCLSMCVIVD